MSKWKKFRVVPDLVLGHAVIPNGTTAYINEHMYKKRGQAILAKVMPYYKKYQYECTDGWGWNESWLIPYEEAFKIGGELL